MKNLTFTKIDFTIESIKEAKKEGYTHLLQVDGYNGRVLYALHSDNWDDSANAIAKEEGFKAHDHRSDFFIGFAIDEGELIVLE